MLNECINKSLFGMRTGTCNRHVFGLEEETSLCPETAFDLLHKVIDRYWHVFERRKFDCELLLLRCARNVYMEGGVMWTGTETVKREGGTMNEYIRMNVSMEGISTNISLSPQGILLLLTLPSPACVPCSGSKSSFPSTFRSDSPPWHAYAQFANLPPAVLRTRQPIPHRLVSASVGLHS